MKKVFMFGLLCLFTMSAGFSAETSNNASKLYEISYENHAYTFHLYADDTILAFIPGAVACVGTVSGVGPVVDFQYESSEGPCERYDIQLYAYSIDSLEILKSMEVGYSYPFTGNSGSYPHHQIRIHVSRIR
jgi:hypothetical protein